VLASAPLIVLTVSTWILLLGHSICQELL